MSKGDTFIMRKAAIQCKDMLDFSHYFWSLTRHSHDELEVPGRGCAATECAFDRARTTEGVLDRKAGGMSLFVRQRLKATLSYVYSTLPN